MKTLPLNSIILEDCCMWLCNILKDGIKKEDINKYKNAWFLFDETGGFILVYSENFQCIYVNYEKIWCVIRDDFKITYDEMDELYFSLMGAAFQLYS